MEKFPENQNNNSESEQLSQKRNKFREQLKKFLWTGTAIAATSLTVGCGKGDNAKNFVKPEIEPIPEANIKNTTTSQDINNITFDDGTSVDFSDDSSEVEEKSGEVNPDDYWEGNVFYLDKYAEALGYDVNTDASSMRYECNDKTAFTLYCPHLKISLCDLSTGEKKQAEYCGDCPFYGEYDGDSTVMCGDHTTVNNPVLIKDYIKTLQWFANTNDPYSYADALDCWEK